jgi:hypothetical protein
MTTQYPPVVDGSYRSKTCVVLTIDGDVHVANYAKYDDDEGSWVSDSGFNIEVKVAAWKYESDVAQFLKS